MNKITLTEIIHLIDHNCPYCQTSLEYDEGYLHCPLCKKGWKYKDIETYKRLYENELNAFQNKR